MMISATSSMLSTPNRSRISLLSASFFLLALLGDVSGDEPKVAVFYFDSDGLLVAVLFTSGLPWCSMEL